MGLSATTVYKKLASMLAEKWNISYSCCVFWLRCWVSFSLLRSAIMCVRGNRSSVRRPVVDNVNVGGVYFTEQNRTKVTELLRYKSRNFILY